MGKLITVAADFVLAIIGLIAGAFVGYLLAYWWFERHSAGGRFYLDVVGPFSALVGAGIGGMLGANTRRWCQAFLGRQR